MIKTIIYLSTGSVVLSECEVLCEIPNILYSTENIQKWICTEDDGMYKHNYEKEKR